MFYGITTLWLGSGLVRDKNHLVRLGESSWFGLKWSLDTWCGLKLLLSNLHHYGNSKHHDNISYAFKKIVPICGWKQQSSPSYFLQVKIYPTHHLQIWRFVTFYSRQMNSNTYLVEFSRLSKAKHGTDTLSSRISAGLLLYEITVEESLLYQKGWIAL